MFAVLSFTCVLPIAVDIMQHGQCQKGFALTHIAVVILLYSLALFFYLTHIPEKWWPNSFDIWVSGSLFLHCSLG